MSVVGTELKLNVHVEPIGGIHLADCRFTCKFFTSAAKPMVIAKDQMNQVDEDNFIAIIDSGKLGAGTIKMTITVEVPDSDFRDGYRTEIDTVCTGITITRADACK